MDEVMPLADYVQPSIGLCGIEMELVGLSREAANLLQSDCVELKSVQTARKMAARAAFNRTVWN